MSGWILLSRRPRSSAQRLNEIVSTYHDIAALTKVYLARASGSEAELRTVDFGDSGCNNTTNR